jgi:hypothetical protein
VARRRRQAHGLERVLGTPALFATAYGNVGSSIYYARRGSEIVVVRRQAVFSDTVDYILEHAPCRVPAAARRAVA